MSSQRSFADNFHRCRQQTHPVMYFVFEIRWRRRINVAQKLYFVSANVHYTTPVWGPILVKESSRDFKKICDSAIAEKINMKLCKYILGSGKYSANCTVRGELGRYPVMIKVSSNIFKSFQRLQNLPDSTLVKSSHQDVILQHQFLIRHPSSTNLTTIVSDDSAAPAMTQLLNSSLWWSLTTSKHGWTQFIMVASYDHTPL